MPFTFSWQAPYTFCRMKELQILKDMDLEMIRLILKRSFRRYIYNFDWISCWIWKWYDAKGFSLYRMTQKLKMQLRYQFNMKRPIHRWIWNTINQISRERSNSITPGGVIRTQEVVVVEEVVGGVIQMVVGVAVVAEDTKMAVINTMTSLEIIIQGTIITIEEEGAEVVATRTATMVLVVKLIMLLQVMLGCNRDKLWVVHSVCYCNWLEVNPFIRLASNMFWTIFVWHFQHSDSSIL